ncbi:telomere-protecting terminal protein Tpg [Streptomyces sp. NPDC002730]|uniref:telomere-protecting terminal protein Tpg n=1 Tax=Streptomyces sp. NPDC002730 TaxID=3364662 RepID=UPI003676DB11
MTMFGDGLDTAVQRAFTRPIPKSAGAQMRYLVRQLKGTKAAAEALGISQRTVERYVKGQFKKPRKDLADRLESEVKKRWPPQIKEKAKQRAATTGGIVIDTRARFGYTAAPGTTDDARLRHLTVALPPTYAARLFEARDQGASDQQLQEIAAEGLQEVYFKDGGHLLLPRAHRRPRSVREPTDRTGHGQGLSAVP